MVHTAKTGRDLPLAIRPEQMFVDYKQDVLPRHLEDSGSS